MKQVCDFNLADEARRINDFLNEFWKEWPEVSTATSVWQRESREPQPRETLQFDVIYDCFPFLFYPDFPSVPLMTVRTLAQAGRLYAFHVFLCDGLIDTQPIQYADTILRASLVQSEALHLLYQLFPAEHAFWLQFKRFRHSYMDALQLEQKWRQSLFADFDLTTAERIANGKAALTSVAIAALALLSGKEESQGVMLESLRLANIGLQFYDDLRDWKEDLLAGQPSLLLAELCQKVGWKTLPDTAEERAEGVGYLKPYLYKSGIAPSAAARAAAYFLQAQSVLEALPPPAPTSQPRQLTWRRFLENCYRSTIELESDLRRQTPNGTRHKSNRAGSVQQENVGQIDRMLERAITYLAYKQGQGGEWGDFLFSIGHSTDWVSGYVGQSLLPFPVYHLQLEKAARWLLKTCGEESGWGYNSRAPRDADSTSNCALFLLGLVNKTKGGDEQLISSSRAILSSIAALLQRYQHTNGGFSTYIPEDGQGGCYVVKACWLEPHLEITATCARYLLAVAGKVTAQIEVALNMLLEHQTDEGTWMAYWYDGPFYATAQTMRLMEEAVAVGWNDQRIGGTIRRALRFILQTQQASGGWSLRSELDKEAQAISTALALHTLLAGLNLLALPRLSSYEPAKEASDDDAFILSHSDDCLRNGLLWLERHQADDGSWLPSYILRTPAPDCRTPWLSEFPPALHADFNYVVRDQQRLFTGSTVVQMLTALQAQPHLLSRLMPGTRAEE